MISRIRVANAELQARRMAAVPRGVATATQVFAERASNSEIWDADGKHYIDFASGIAVVATGHRHPHVMQAVAKQLDAYTHTAFQVMAYEPYIALAERLNALAPFTEPAQTLLLTTGAEAVENAVKIARIATRRNAVIAFSGGFHGRTHMAMALTGKVSPYKDAMLSLGADVYHLPLPAEHLGEGPELALRALDSVFYADVAPTNVAAIIVEPIQGEGGFNVVSSALLQELRRICDQQGILLISDEIQTGFGRTGKWFAIEHAGVEPDLLTVAKSLAGGFPLAGVIGKKSIMDKVEPGGLGGTYGGSPVGCAAALAVLEVIENEKLLERAELLGKIIRGTVQSWIGKPALLPIRNLRGRAAMLGFDVPPREGGEGRGVAAKAVLRKAADSGLVVLNCGKFGETIRILVPLTISESLLSEGLGILEKALQA